MKRIIDSFKLTLLGVLVATGLQSVVKAANIPAGPMPEATEEFVEKGRGIYFQRCSFCHGLLGDGEGPAAKYLDPRPRDFTLGTFKFAQPKVVNCQQMGTCFARSAADCSAQQCRLLTAI